MQPAKRQEQFQRNQNLESLLREINGLLEPVEQSVLQSYRMPKYPVVLVVGAPRSGTTLLMQWLAQTGYFAYPTNLLSRFFAAPYIGAKIQQLLTAPEFNFNDELFEFGGQISFDSNLGKTKGVLEPNEFWYFWRRFIPNEQPEYLDEESLAKVDAAGFAAELAAIEAVFDKPFALKGHILEYNIPFLSDILDRALFVFIERHPFYNIQSLLEARVKYYGDQSSWYSVKPKEYDMLKVLDPFEQVAGQIFYTNCAIRAGLDQIDPARGLTVSYEEFCDSPEQVFRRIMERFSQQGLHVDWDYTGPSQFHTTNQVRLSEEDWARVAKAHKHFSGKEVSR